MLNENLKNLRKTKGLSQEELATRLNIVRQTLSKWEKGLSVPDAEMLIRIADVLDTSVSALLGENTLCEKQTELKIVAAKLEQLNVQLARQNEVRRKLLRTIFIIAVILSGAVLLREMFDMIWHWSAMKSLEASSAIIGGADGPTAIVVAGQFRPGPILFSITALVVATIGICRTRKT